MARMNDVFSKLPPVKMPAVVLRDRNRNSGAKRSHVTGEEVRWFGENLAT